MTSIGPPDTAADYGAAPRRQQSPVRTPRYYPDAITLLPEITLEQVPSGIDTSEGCSVKDSFAGLDLAAGRFRLRATRQEASRDVARQVGVWRLAGGDMLRVVLSRRGSRYAL